MDAAACTAPPFCSNRVDTPHCCAAMADPCIAWPAIVAGRLLLSRALDRPLPTLSEAAQLLAPADAFSLMCLALGHAGLEPCCLAGSELAE